jgi:hypothetical protein
VAESKGMHSYNTELFAAQYGTANPAGADPEAAGFTKIAEVLSVNGLPMNSAVTRLTHLGSDGKAHEKVPGFLDAGQITMRLNYHAAAVPGQLALPALMALTPGAAETAPDWGRKQWVVQFPDGGQWYATGFVQGTPFEVPEDDRPTVEVTIEVSGRPAFTDI